MPRRHFAIALACAVAGAMQALHSLAYAGTIQLGGVAFAIATTAIEIVVLTLVFGRRAAGASPGARWLFAALGDLLRDSLEERGETHTLAEEIAWLRRYAHVIEARHRVRFRWDVDLASENVLIPRMLLQPLVENAVKHGALHCRDDGEVSV